MTCKRGCKKICIENLIKCLESNDKDCSRDFYRKWVSDKDGDGDYIIYSTRYMKKVDKDDDN